MKRGIIIILLLVIAAYLGISWFFSNLILHPSQGNPVERTEQMLRIQGPNARPINTWLSVPDSFSVKAEDGVQIRGWHFKAPAAKCAVIMAHGWSGNRMGMNKYMYLFEDCACDIITYDHRGHNTSDPALATGGIKESQDLLSVTNWVQANTQFPDEQIGWVGVSWGGATVLQAGASKEDVGFIIADCPFQDWDSAVMERAIRDYGNWINLFVPTIKAIVYLRAGVNFDAASALNNASYIDEPVFLIHSKADAATASSQSVNIAAQLNPKHSVFHHTEWGNDHAKDISNNPAEFKALVDDFLAELVPNFGACQ